MTFTLKATALFAAMAAGSAMAAQTGGFASTDGGNITGAKSFTAATYQEINTIIANARLDANGKKVTGGAYPVIITYTGNEDAAIAQIIKDSTPDSTGTCPAPHWSDSFREVPIKEFTAGVTIIGANGSSGNFGITLSKSSNVIIRNMKLGALGGASNDADLLRVDSSTNVWIDHNELFSSNHECAGSPDGDLTFEGALDIKKDSHNITVSYNYIHDHKKVGLDGSSSSDIAGGREITFHHNLYSNVNARLPLQRGGWTHEYNNLYSGLTGSGINVRQAGYALVEKNWFENSYNPVTCRYDSSNCGFWDLRGNNLTSAADNATYGITWTMEESSYINASNWTTTATFPKTLGYTYEPVSPQCVKDKLAQYAGVGKNSAQLVASACSGSGSSSSSASSSSKSSSSSSSAASSSSSSKSSASSSSSSSSSKSSSSSSSSSSTPVMSGTGDYPSGFSKCAALGETCTVSSGTGWVAFGRKGSWVAKYVGVGNSIACTVAAFGSDPAGNPNKCSYQK